MDLFDYLSLAATIDNTQFAVHGGDAMLTWHDFLTRDTKGLSPDILCIDQIKVLDRFQELPTVGPIADLMWSDPDPDNEGFNLSQRHAAEDYRNRN